MIANTPLAEMAELKALATRISVVKLEVTDSELVALMRDQASQGHRNQHGNLSPAVCLDIAEFVIAQCCQAKCPLDMRLYVNALLDFQQWQQDQSSCHWHTLVANRVRQSAAHRLEEIAHQAKQAEIDHELEIVRNILEQTAHLRGKTRTSECVKRFFERTGKAPATWYRRLKEVRAEDIIAREDKEDYEDV
jgi:hypothetical protein